MTALIDIDQLRTFIAIAETGSFTKAAEVVHKTQSAVSMQMKRLEERLDKPIFARDGRASKLTEDGERLLDYARRIVKLNRRGARRLFRRRTVRPRAARRAGRLCRPLSAGNHGALFARLSGRRTDGDLRAVGRSAASASTPTISISRSSPTTETQRDRGALPAGAAAVGDVGAARDAYRRSAAARARQAELRAGAAIALECLETIGRPHRVLYTSSNAGAYVAAVLSGLAVSVVPESALAARHAGADSGRRISGTAASAASAWCAIRMKARRWPTRSPSTSSRRSTTCRKPRRRRSRRGDYVFAGRSTSTLPISTATRPSAATSVHWKFSTTVETASATTGPSTVT